MVFLPDPEPAVMTVMATLQCNLYEADGTRCPNPTGNTEAGVDADLCPEHRQVMAEQRKARQ